MSAKNSLRLFNEHAKAILEVTLPDKISTSKTDEFLGSVSKILSGEKNFLAKLNFVNKYLDKTDENLGQYRKFCPAKNFVRRKFCLPSILSDKVHTCTHTWPTR